MRACANDSRWLAWRGGTPTRSSVRCLPAARGRATNSISAGRGYQTACGKGADSKAAGRALPATHPHTEPPLPAGAPPAGGCAREWGPGGTQPAARSAGTGVWRGGWGGGGGSCCTLPAAAAATGLPVHPGLPAPIRPKGCAWAALSEFNGSTGGSMPRTVAGSDARHSPAASPRAAQ